MQTETGIVGGFYAGAVVFFIFLKDNVEHCQGYQVIAPLGIAKVLKVGDTIEYELVEYNQGRFISIVASGSLPSPT